MKLIKEMVKSLLLKFGIIRRMPLENSQKYSSFYPYHRLEKLSDSELLSLMRHEAHRIEKSIYNNIFQLKYSVYLEKARRLDYIFTILESRHSYFSEPTLNWAKDIRASFDNLESDFIIPNSGESKPFSKLSLIDYCRQAKERRSIRVWADNQPNKSDWLEIADLIIDCARWTPCSGNRQPWRFKVLIEKEQKLLLTKLKEEHCTNAPLLIFVGMDKRFYGSLSKGKHETALFVDAGAAIMNMIVGANQAGLGTCWNHFGKDMIASREVNKLAYKNFCKKMDIEEYIEPVAILAVGLPEYIPPTPARMTVDRIKI